MNRILLHVVCVVLICAIALAAPFIAPRLGTTETGLLLIATVVACLPKFHPVVFQRLKQQRLERLERLSPPGWPFGFLLVAIFLLAVFGSITLVASLMATLLFVTNAGVMLHAVLPLPRDLTDTPSPSDG